MTTQSLMAEAVGRHQAGQLAEAASLYRQILAQDGRNVQAQSNLGVALRGLGQTDEAEACYRRAIAIQPGFADAHINLANLLKRSHPAEALQSYERAIALKPGDAALFYNYGTTLQEQGRLDDAAAAYERAVALNPGLVQAWSNLGVARADRHQYEAAVEAYRKAIALKPDFVQALNNLGLVLQEQGLLAEAIAVFERAMVIDPGHAESRTNRIFAELYRPGVRLADLQRLSRREDTSVAAPALRNSEKPRLGFVSADLRQHPVGFLVIPALEALQRLGFEIVCYSNSNIEDDLTARFSQCATHWRQIAALDDQALAAQVHADGIDILFDLSGHSRGNRLGAFALRPAPIQIAWAGYPATTGLAAMDYLLTDRWQTPEDADAFYSEKLLRLPHSYIAFGPPPGAPEPGPLPARANGHVTFACFNALKKINDDVLGAWARILTRLPDARLLLKSPPLDDAATHTRVAARLAAAGIAPSRVTFLGASSSADHVAAMARADIALDTFPYSGGMTTLESLWMGLPVITWPGETFASRHALGYLATLGLTELIADSVDDYVTRAVTLTNDIERLSELRGAMRARILSSPLSDADGFAASLATMLAGIAKN